MAGFAFPEARRCSVENRISAAESCIWSGCDAIDPIICRSAWRIPFGAVWVWYSWLGAMTTTALPQPTRARADRAIGIASSAGGVGALGKLLSTLPAQFPAAILIVQHIDRHHPSVLADILSRRASLTVKQASEGDVLHDGCVYVAPPDRHMLVTPERVLSLSAAELVHFVRPSADLLFESLAGSYRERAIAVVLTGTGQDGAAGVVAIKKTGGTVIAQDKASSEFFGMPEAAANTGRVDMVLSLDLIASKLLELVAVRTP